MAEINRRFLDDMCRSGLVRDGHFVFRSGQHSGVALDRDRLLSDPGFASHLGYVIAKHFFSSVVETVAAPSMWGAALAQWVAYFLQPRATIVFAQPSNGGFAIPPSLKDAINGKRILLVDNLILTGETMGRFVRSIEAEGGEIVGAGTIWNLADIELPGKEIFGLFNAQYPVYAADACPFCAAGTPLEATPYEIPARRTGNRDRDWSSSMSFQRRGGQRPRPRSQAQPDSPPENLPVSGTISAIKNQERNPERINVFLDGEFAFAVTREEAQTQGLKIGRELTVDEVGTLRARDVVNKATESALRLLSFRSRSEKELRDRLKQKSYEPETIEAVIERVRNWGYLDDADFAQRWVANRVEHQPRGRRMLEQELRQKGVDRETITETLDEADIDETAAAIAVAEKSANRLRGLDPVVARRRLTGQLARRGFGYPAIKAAIDRALGERENDEEEVEE